MNKRSDDRGNLSIDFLAGFTIFMLAFIWVASMISGVLLGLQSATIDYEAVAYRTGVILVEDPGWPSSPPWEFYTDGQKFEISRFGLATSKDTPNILSQDKVNRFFCSSFIYPDDYHTRSVFGDFPYRFNISVKELDGGYGKSVGTVLPEGHGYIRRLVKIKGSSNATINLSYIVAHKFNTTFSAEDVNVTSHEFSIQINSTKLHEEMPNPAYQIDPAREQIMINITDLNSTVKLSPLTSAATFRVELDSIRFLVKSGGTLSTVRTFDTPIIDGESQTLATKPWIVKDNVSLIIDPRTFDIMQAGYSSVYINMTFRMKDNSGADAYSAFLNNTRSRPFDYNYFPENVTQPVLRDAVVEVAVW